MPFFENAHAILRICFEKLILKHISDNFKTDSNCFRLRKDTIQGTTSTYLSYIMICIYPLALARQNTW